MSLLRTVPSQRRTRVRRSDRILHLELLEPRLLLASFTVTSAADDGAGTLRQVIKSLDGSTDLANTVSFDIGSGPQTISLQSSLPAITVPVFIDGESQPGYSDTPLIQIDGNGVLGSGSGLTLSPGSDGSTIQGLDIYGFSQGAGLLIQSSNNVIESSYLGTDGTRTIEEPEEPNRLGVVISGTNPFSVPEYNEFSGCTFSGNSATGVYMSNASFNEFARCTFSGSTVAGVIMIAAYSSSFTDCTFSGNLGDGVDMSSTAYNSFTGCTFSGNSGDGVDLSSADYNSFTDCTFSGNTGEGVYMSNAQFSSSFTDCTFSGNSGDGVDLSSAAYSSFTDCTFSGNSGDGVDLSSAAYNSFTDCTFSGNTGEGVYMSNAPSNEFARCTFSGNTVDGVYMSNASSNEFARCTFSGNTDDGVDMSSLLSNTFTGCTFSGNTGSAGVYMSSADYNTFIDCTFSGNTGEGVYMSSAEYNSFTGCNFTGNSETGLFISGSLSLNTFIDCTFSGNTVDGVDISTSTSIISISNTYFTFIGCTFSKNSGDGVDMSSDAFISFKNCNFTGNSGDGVDMSGASFSTFTRCTIAGNNDYGIFISSMSDYNVIDENYCIGTPSNGSSTQQVGILINDSINNTIGGTTAGSTSPANVIGGSNVGIEITGFNSNLTGGNVIEGNYIGVTEDGSPIGNLYGIWINDVPYNTIGGTAEGASNTISDNTWAGVYISGLDATGNLVEGNSILGPNNKGTRTSPTNPLPIGVFIQNSSSNTIGGAGAGEGNTISGNNVGVYIVGTGGPSTDNQVLGNFIGLSADGGSPPGNVLYGVMLVNAPNNNAPQSGPSANKIVGSGIANYREYSGPIDPTTQSSSGSGSKAKKPAIHSDHVAHQTPRRTALHAQVTAHGHTVPAVPLRKPRARVRH